MVNYQMGTSLGYQIVYGSKDSQKKALMEEIIKSFKFKK